MAGSRGLACSAEFMRRFERLAVEAGWKPDNSSRGAAKHVVDSLRHHLCLGRSEVYHLLTAARLAKKVSPRTWTTEAPHPTILREAARAGKDAEVEVATKAIEHGWTQQEVQAEVRRRRLANVPPLPKGQYAVVYADPPWSFANSGFEQSAASQYPTMAVNDIAALDLPCARDSVCFLWVPNALLPDGLTVLKAWGFDYKTYFVWLKDRAPGMGWYCQTRHETLLLGSRGSPPMPASKPWSVLSAPVGKHSAKPIKFYGLIETMYRGPYLELFARTRRDAWTAWGSDLP